MDITEKSEDVFSVKTQRAWFDFLQSESVLTINRQSGTITLKKSVLFGLMKKSKTISINQLAIIEYDLNIGNAGQLAKMKFTSTNKSKLKFLIRRLHNVDTSSYSYCDEQSIAEQLASFVGKPLMLTGWAKLRQSK